MIKYCIELKDKKANKLKKIFFSKFLLGGEEVEDLDKKTVYVWTEGAWCCDNSRYYNFYPYGKVKYPCVSENHKKEDCARVPNERFELIFIKNQTTGNYIFVQEIATYIAYLKHRDTDEISEMPFNGTEEFALYNINNILHSLFNKNYIKLEVMYVENKDTGKILVDNRNMGVINE